MVFIIDDGSKFKAPLDKVWKLAQSEGQHVHPSMKNTRVEPAGENSVFMTYDTEAGGKMLKNKLKMTLYPPLGFALEYLEGPLNGSKAFQYYTPKGKETGATVIGEWTSPVMPADQVKKAVLAYLEQAFKEDVENLKKI